ncbi:MAG: alpha-glucosidase C-terminal domain-containing protein [Ignavibacteriaceae bacterium]|nr:alpha-glucosidase C-terminal domain-containing protein [Ignavibacteriaceae bacterium]
MKYLNVKIVRSTLVALLFLILVQISLFSQDHQDWSYNLSIYEVNVRQYTSSGTFTEFGTHLNRLKELGVGIIWFMPIHPIGVKNRLGSLGSYYSVKDYYGINPEFGTLENFKALVDSIHAKGMYVLIDWVGNHTSWDNSLTVTHPEWYVKDGNGKFIPPPGTNWSDVIQLDYSKPELRQYMIDAMKFWINETHIDGFRCDAVSFMPLDFWTTAIAELKKVKPGILMIAEDDKTEYQFAGFDMSYAWGMYGFGNGVLVKIVNGTNNANFLNTLSNQENTNFPPPHYRMYFTSNHDENSWYGTDFELFGNAAEQFAVLISTFRSMPLIYGGQEAGLNHRLKFFDKDQIIWKTHPFSDLYKKLFQLKRNNKALWNGAAGGVLQRVLTTNNPAIFAFIRSKENCKVFAIFNVTNQAATFTLQDALYTGRYRDVFSNDSVTFFENTQLTLPAWGYKVYEIGSGVTEVEDERSLPSQYLLLQNYPNPFNSSTRIKFQVPNTASVTLRIFDVLGNEIEILVNKEMEFGSYEVDFEAAQLPSGVYFYQLKSGHFVDTKKLLLLR